MSFLGFDLLRAPELAWLAGSIAVLAIGWWSLARRERERKALVSERQLLRVLPHFSSTRARLRLALAVLALASLAFALTGPVRGYTVRPVQRRGVDLVVCLDTSRSMFVRDVRPDRLTRAKREISDLFEKMRGDRAALIAFSGEPRQVAPLTHDVVTLQKLLAQTSPDDNTLGGTDIGTALKRALDVFDGATGAHEAIVLVTDGEDLEGKGLEVAKQAAERGIRIFVLGMGTEQGGKIPIATDGGGETLLRDEDGKEVVSTMDAKSLIKLAESTGGTYIGATENATPLEELYTKRITKIEGHEYESGEERVPQDRFQWFAALAIACMIFEFGLREKKPRPDPQFVALRRKEAA